MLKYLFPKTRGSLLTLLFSHTDDSFYVREIINKIGAGQGSVQRELNSLTEAGIIERERIGNQVHYRTNKANPIFEDLRNLILKTSGLSSSLREALNPVVERIRVAFIYGSIAKGGADIDSDIDLMIIGDLKIADIAGLIDKAEGVVGREINPTIYPSREFRKKVDTSNRFISSVLREEKIFVIGAEDELRRICSQKTGKAT